MRQAPSKSKTQKLPWRKLALRPTGNTTRAATGIQQLIKNAPAAIFVFQGKKNVFANRAAEDLTGYTRQELLQMDFWNILHFDFRMKVRQRGMGRHGRIKIPARYEVRLVRKDVAGLGSGLVS